MCLHRRRYFTLHNKLIFSEITLDLRLELHWGEKITQEESRSWV